MRLLLYLLLCYHVSPIISDSDYDYYYWWYYDTPSPTIPSQTTPSPTTSECQSQRSYSVCLALGCVWDIEGCIDIDGEGYGYGCCTDAPDTC